jgi:hypothetical protein
MDTVPDPSRRKAIMKGIASMEWATSSGRPQGHEEGLGEVSHER